MNRKYAALLAILVATSFLGSIPPASSHAFLSLVPLESEFTGLPGDTILVPFKLSNVGNETVENITVYITGPESGFLYESRLIPTPLEPNSSITDAVSVRITDATPGKYNLTLVARAGAMYSQAVISVTVGVLVDYVVSISVGSEYMYGSNVSMLLKIESRSNGVLNGLVGYSLERNGTLVDSWNRALYVMPGKNWSERILLTNPAPGIYKVKFWANFGGKRKQVTRSFIVYKRWLGYSLYFRDGAIHVLVYDKNGIGVQGIPVTIDNETFVTGVDGSLSYPVSEPGVYEVVLNLDGERVRTYIDVKKLFLSYVQRNSTLEITVEDSFGNPVPNVTVVAIGPEGRDYSLTDSSGKAVVSLDKIGYGTVLVKAESPMYLGGSIEVLIPQPEVPKPSNTSTPTPPTNTTIPVRPKKHRILPIILLLGGVLLAGTSYVAFFMPTVQEERLDRYYFVKVKAPKLRGVENFRFERSVSAVEARTTKGSVKIDNSTVIWEIDRLEPEEEAYLQVILG